MLFAGEKRKGHFTYFLSAIIFIYLRLNSFICDTNFLSALLAVYLRF
ncbi:hypothetical protein L1279_002123 [Planomicrobium sp. HSC-17F08]|nr:hypothetical protein [Planomicrobium sp. HSC-17F08]